MSRRKIREQRTHKCPLRNKEIKRGHGYYRDGIYYCSRNCWRKHIKKLREEAEKKDK